MGELEGTLKWFKKDKILGSDGWSVEFYPKFFDTIGPDLLDVIKEWHSSIRMFAPYIALIPKMDSPLSFNDFMPISLCKCLYKIIAKIIANHIKSMLSKKISSKQFAFLQNRQIHEAISTTQEALHSIKQKKLEGVMLKIYLSEAFDRVNWLF